ncbi:MAG: acyl transferase [Flavobacteriaceae bacterium]|nr:acyl transferase [Bacteroidia bacterium]NND11243.1 acyl transferase [Flavobacteriaceae bacterium]NNL60335.1 acyl transferase [Flavobacteriaceae bacterium]RZV69610.1 MAG: acyl transferase [Flavobacteriaceae bacterium]
MSDIKAEDIFSISSDEEFNDMALKVFRHQFENNQVYRSFCDLLYKHPSDITTIEEIPFLPIQFFKSHKVLSTTNEIVKVFRSSGTTGQITSTHYVTDLDVYKQSFRKGFNQFYGNIKDHIVLGLLPSYLERDNSSLVYMINDLIQQSNHPESGFYLNNLKELSQVLRKMDSEGENVLLIGVSFALLDLLEIDSFKLTNTIVMETGGMKGRRKEMIRTELHDILKTGFGVKNIHSEYGMTELLSQAYSHGDGVFECPPWMKIMIRNTEDALTLERQGKTGGINVIDLANINSCSFIATQDLGKIIQNESFEILGRFDHSDIRGCNLMAL